MGFLKEMCCHFYNDSKKYTIVWGSSFAIYASIAISSNPRPMTLIEKLNAAGQYWKVMLAISTLAFVLQTIKYILKRFNA